MRHSQCQWTSLLPNENDITRCSPTGMDLVWRASSFCFWLFKFNLIPDTDINAQNETDSILQTTFLSELPCKKTGLEHAKQVLSH